MKIKPFAMLAFVFLWLTQLPLAFAEDANVYRLRQGDGVQISVWGEASLNKEVRVLPDGSVTFPLAGRVLSGDDLSRVGAEMRARRGLSSPQ